MRPFRPPKGRVLVLAPHPDDESLGCGGAVLKHRARGDAVTTVFLTDGAKGDPDRLYSPARYRGLRRREARRAARVLGAHEPQFWDYPDRRLSRCGALRTRLRKLIGELSPRTVYFTSAAEPHPDHKALGRAAAGLVPGFPRTRFLAYEVESMPKPGMVLDISGEFDRKMEAVACYRSQLRYRDLRALALRTNALRSLFLKGSSFAEAFS